MRRVLGELFLLAALISFLIFLDLMGTVNVLSKTSDVLITLDNLPQGVAIIFGLLTLFFISLTLYLLTPPRPQTAPGEVMIRRGYTVSKSSLENLLTEAVNSLPHCSATCSVTRTSAPIAVKCVVHSFTEPPRKVSAEVKNTILRVLKKEIGARKASVFVVFEGGKEVEGGAHVESGGPQKPLSGGGDDISTSEAEN